MNDANKTQLHESLVHLHLITLHQSHFYNSQ